jgi:DedD protein
MATRSEAPTPPVDELKRRARRRLVGAIVLALAAAVILPLLFESDPKPLGDDVSVRIPPVDNAKFISPISPDRARDAAPRPADAKASATPAQKKTIADAERRVLGQGAGSSPQADATPSVVADPAVPKADAPAAKVDAPAAKADAPAAKVDVPPKSDAPAPKESAATATPSATSGGIAVQVAAYVDAKVAADLVAVLKAKGFSAYTEGVQTDHGTVQRVRVGPFASRGDADAAAVKLRAAGYDRALVTAVQ